MPAIQVLSNYEIDHAMPSSVWKNQQYQCGDCPEVSVASKSPRLKFVDFNFDLSFDAALIPRLRNQLYLKWFNQNYMTAYNPNGCYGVTVLNREMAELFEAIDNKRSCGELACYLKWPLAEVYKAIQKLEEAELIYTQEKEPEIIFSTSRTLTAWLHVSNQCNLRCTYCYVSKTSHYMPLEMGKQALDEIFQSALKYGHQEVVLKFAGGEALIVFPLVQALIAYARQLALEKNLRMQPVILTNGTLVTAKMARLFKKEDCVIAVSLDGLAEYNDVTRPTIGGKGSFWKIERGLRILRHYEVNFHISVVVSKYNLEHLPKLTQYLLRHKRSFTFNFFRENELSDQGQSVENERLIEWLGRAYEVIAKNLPAHSLMNAILDRVQFNQPHLQACGAGTNYIVVKHTGEIVGCQMHLQKPSIGRVGRQADLVQLVRQSSFIPVQTQDPKKKEGCASCQWRYVCAGGCPVMTFMTAGRYDTRSPFCDTYQTLIPQVIELEAARILKYAQPND